MAWLLLPVTLAAMIGVAVGAVVWKKNRRRARGIRAQEEFLASLKELERLFLECASRSGKPRGLSWKICDLSAESVIFACNKETRRLTALAGATIGFEAIAGGDMEEVEAVGDLRAATVIFEFDQNQWTTAGQVLFNLTPEASLERLGTLLVDLHP